MSTEYTNYLRILASHDGEVARRAQAELMKTVNLDEVVDPVDGETLRDVLRHDKGHDDWHAAHGDPPCKNEADCIRMRAKYNDDDGAGVEKSKNDIKYENMISDRKGEPIDNDLYAKVIAEAKSKFDVYPSAVANGWVVQEYKRRGGKYRKSVSKAAPNGDSFAPPSGVQNAAKRALEWIADGKAGDGFTDVGRKRASDLARGASLSLKTIKRMKAYFDRHQSDKKATGFSSGEEGFPSPGRVAWDAWGGDAGYSWASGIAERSDKKVKKTKTVIKQLKRMKKADPSLTEEINRLIEHVEKKNDKLSKYNEDQERDDHGRFGSGGGSSITQEGHDLAFGYRDELSKAGIDPTEKITSKTNVTETLNRMSNEGVGNGYGYLRERDGVSDKKLGKADKMIRDLAVRNNWSMEHLALFADSKAGRHFADIAFKTGADPMDIKAYLISGAKSLGLGE